MHAEAAEWIADFETRLPTTGPTEIAHLLVMLGPDDPNVLTDWYVYDYDDVLNWIYLYQKTYNAAIHRVLLSRPGLVSKLRRVLRTDLKRATENKHKIAINSYAQALLNNFLTKTPNPAWVK